MYTYFLEVKIENDWPTFTFERYTENYWKLWVMGDLFQIWKKLMSEKTDSGFNEFDAFVAGYFMGTNSNLREKYMKLKPREEFDLKFL